MDSNLLKEAIADAKAVRQTALANAKAALEEVFENRFTAVLAPQLQKETAVEPPVAPNAPVAETGQMEEVGQSDIAEIIKELEADLQQNPTGLPGEEPVAPAPMPMGDPAAAGAPPVPGPMGLGGPVPPVPGPIGLGGPVPPAPEAGMGGPVPPAPEAGMGGPVPPAPAPAVPQNPEDEMDEEIDISELLEALKAETEEEEDKDKVDESVPVHSSGIATSDNKKPSSDASQSSHIESAGKDRVGGGEGYKSGPADATTASRPNKAKNATKTNLSTPGGVNETVETGVPGGSVEAKEPTEADRPNAGPVDAEHMDTPKLAKENAELKNQLNEAVKTLTYLRGQLNEINLLNAKLLYTNKLFKEYSMANDKKMKIVEMFDLAKNVREVKMTYAVIAESLNFGADFQKRPSSKVQKITEGMASRPVAGTAPRQIIAEAAKSDMVAKFQKLAGISSR